jgi:hypothetical protein
LEMEGEMSHLISTLWRWKLAIGLVVFVLSKMYDDSRFFGDGRRAMDML